MPASASETACGDYEDSPIWSYIFYYRRRQKLMTTSEQIPSDRQAAINIFKTVKQ
jgi:hypothetical protein